LDDDGDTITQWGEERGYHILLQEIWIFGCGWYTFLGGCNLACYLGNDLIHFSSEKCNFLLDRLMICCYNLTLLWECYNTMSKNSRTKDKVTIKIPRNLYNRLSEIVQGSGFNSVTDFIVYVLRDLVSYKGILEGEGLSKTEIELIRQRLKSLGYL